MLDVDALGNIMEAFDDLDNAAQRVLTSLPNQMTDAAENLERQRRKFRDLLQAEFISIHRKGVEPNA